MKPLRDAGLSDEIVSCGFTERTLNRCFNAIANPADWKEPIVQVHVLPIDLAPTCAAILFYTATHPRVSFCPATGGFWVSADGYRAGPAGDH